MSAKTKQLAEPTPGRELTLLDDMDRMFENFFRRCWLRPFRELWPDWARMEEGMGFRAPRVDVIDRDDEMVVRAEVPGIQREELAVEMAGGKLTIRGERRHEEKTERGNLLQSEIYQGAFSRTLTLPTGLDVEHAKADFRDGILEVHLPKLEKTERRKIEIS